jgi:(2S)-methylsuccinyl-CoA dehydrogenase
MPHDGQALDLSPLTTIWSRRPAALPALERCRQRPPSVCAPQSPRAARSAPRGWRPGSAQAHGLAWLATYVESLRQMQAWATRLSADGRFGEMESADPADRRYGEYLAQIAGRHPHEPGRDPAPFGSGA